MKKSLIIFALLAIVVIAGCSQQAAETQQNEGDKKITGFVLGGEEPAKDSMKQDTQVVDWEYCVSDDDCACGLSTVTAECGPGNRDYVKDMDEYNHDGGVCRTECNGLIGQTEVACVDNVCVWM